MESIWEKTCKGPTRPPLYGKAQADVAVIGGGMTGILTALELQERGLHDIQDINADMLSLRAGSRITNRHARHILLFAKNQMGLRNLYRLISDSNLKYFKRTPRIPARSRARSVSVSAQAGPSVP